MEIPSSLFWPRGPSVPLAQCAAGLPPPPSWAKVEAQQPQRPSPLLSLMNRARASAAFFLLRLGVGPDTDRAPIRAWASAPRLVPIKA